MSFPALTLAFAFVSVFLVGCAPIVRGTVRSQLNPQYPVNPQMSVLVLNGGAPGVDERRTQKHLSLVAEGLKRMGFLRVYVGALPARVAQADLDMTADLQRNSSTYTYNAPDYRDVRHRRRVCHRVRGRDGEWCEYEYRTKREVVGYSPRRGVREDYSATLSWKLNQVPIADVLWQRIDSRDPPCGEDFNFATLIDYGMEKMDLNREGQVSFQVEMPRQLCRR